MPPMIKRFLKSLSLFICTLLVAACGSPESEFDTFSFTAEDAEEISALLDQIEGEQEGSEGREGGEGSEGTDVVVKEVVLDASDAYRFDNLRTSIGSIEENTFRVTNAFLNVRENPTVHADKVEELSKGDRVKLIEFPNARWAHVQLLDGRKGYVSSSYIAQMVTEAELPEVKKLYEGQYEVNFAYLNVRDTPSSQGLKLGELNGDQVVRPIAFHDEWARIPFDGKEGYVSAEYLRPFTPTFMVRQESFDLPVLRYRGDEPEIADTLVQHLAFLKSNGKKLITMSDFYELLLQQEERDIRLPLGSTLLVITDITSDTVSDISDALRASGIKATLFFRTSDIGPDKISPQLVKTLIANGNDVQSAGHVEDDLRSLTNSQVKLDLAQSRQILEDLTGREVFAIAYPRGGVNERVAEQAVETGYLFGLTLTPSVGEGISRSQFLRMPSNVITPSTTEQTLRTLVGIIE